MGNCGPSKLRESQTQQPQERPRERIKARSLNSSTSTTDAGVSTPETCSEASDEEYSEPRHDKHTSKHTSLVKECLECSGQLRTCCVVHNNATASVGQRIEDIYDGVHNGTVLGEGLSGQVRRIKHRETGVERALKVLDLKGLAQDDIDALLGEIEIMCSLDHPNVVCLEEGKSTLLLSHGYLQTWSRI